MIDSRQAAAALDANDPLASIRDGFILPDDVIYLDGNSLGPLPSNTRSGLSHVIDKEWGEGLIRSWNDADWFEMPVSLGNRLGTKIGAGSGQIVVCDSTSINIYKALKSALGLRPGRSVILSEADSFPTDLYMIEGAMSGDGKPIERRLIGADGASLDDLLDDEVAVVLLSHVNYRTGRILDMKAITQAAHAAGALVIWDLCHSAGIIPVDLDGSNVDFAVGCTYKYLNGGPGAPAFIYVSQRHIGNARQPLSGWWGHAAPFAFEQEFRPVEGIRRFLCGTQPILSMRAVGFALDVLDETTIKAVRKKSLGLTRLFIERMDKITAGHDITLMSPRDDAERGGQVSLSFGRGYAVVRAMIEKGVIGDFRAPDIMRFGFSPLYLRYVDVWDAAEVMAECLADRVWQRADLAAPPAEAVT